MKVTYEGKSPSRFWYFRQYAKALATTPFNKTTRPDAKKLGINAGLFAGTGWVTLNFVMPFLVIPVAGAVAGLVAVGLCARFGFSAFKRFKALKKSSVVTAYIHQKEVNWVASKSRPKLASRLGSAVRKILGAPFVVLRKVLGFPARLLHLPQRQPKQKQKSFVYKRPQADDSPSLSDRIATKVATEVFKEAAKPMVDEARRRAAEIRETNRKIHKPRYGG